MNTLQIEKQFWSHVFRRSTSDAKEKARIKTRLEPDCARYVAIKLKELNGEPPSKLYDGTSDEFLAEMEKKYFELRDEEHARARTTSFESQSARPTRSFFWPGVILVLVLIAFLAYWFWLR